MNGIVRSAPDIHRPTGSASDASMADANVRSRRVGEPSAYRFSAINATTTEIASFTALPRLADPGLGTLTSAYHSSPGCVAAGSNRSALRFDLSCLRRASRELPRASLNLRPLPYLAA